LITHFTINLNKGEDVAEREARWTKRREIITMTVLIIIVSVLTMVNYQQYAAIEGVVKTKEQTIIYIDKQLDSLKKTGKNISKQDVLALAKLEKERVLWTKKLLAIGELLPEDMALTYIDFKNHLLLLRFISKIERGEKEFDRVKLMIDKLRNSPMFFRDFKDMRLKEQHQTDIDEQTILSFSVLCQIEKGKRSKKGRRSRRNSRG
jgi:hypothetical protein